MGKILGLIGIVVVIGAGAYWYTRQSDPQKEAGLSALDAAKEAKESVENKGMIASIKDAMSSGTAMSCTYAVEQGGSTYESTVMVQGEKFRADAAISGMTTHVLFDGADQYMWTEGTKTGFKMSKACLDEMSQTTTSTENQASPPQDAKAAFDAAKNVKCSPAGNIDLSVPADITFTDQCAQMKESMKMMEQYKGQMPPSR